MYNVSTVGLIEYLSRDLGAKVVQTHASWVLITPDVVYKIKKPVNFGFLDYSTLEKRKENCQKEVILNRRLCPHIYLGVVPISLVDGRYMLEDDSNVVEYAVKMKRIPEDSLLINRLPRTTQEDVRMVARLLVDFHAKAERRDEWGRLEVMKFNTDENFVQTEKYVGITIEREAYNYIKKRVEEFYTKYEDIFEKRIREGKIRDGHGDIRLEHIAFLKEGVCIFDCIEFNDRFRCGDVINDMCFLSMELDFYSRRDLSEAYEEEYKKLSKDEDFDLLLNFFKSYRAYVRGKVYSFMLDDPQVEDKEKYRDLARKMFALSLEYTKRMP